MVQKSEKNSVNIKLIYISVEEKRKGAVTSKKNRYLYMFSNREIAKRRTASGGKFIFDALINKKVHTRLDCFIFVTPPLCLNSRGQGSGGDPKSHLATG